DADSRLRAATTSAAAVGVHGTGATTRTMDAAAAAVAKVERASEWVIVRRAATSGTGGADPMARSLAEAQRRAEVYGTRRTHPGAAVRTLAIRARAQAVELIRATHALSAKDW
ncbi:MAG: hypothetical protein ACRDHP_15110, partial [Ktedonobacterales bacterium]